MGDPISPKAAFHGGGDSNVSPQPPCLPILKLGKISGLFAHHPVKRRLCVMRQWRRMITVKRDEVFQCIFQRHRQFILCL